MRRASGVAFPSGRAFLSHLVFKGVLFMCGRFTLHHSTEQVAKRFEIQKVLFSLDARYNIAPSQPVAAVLQNGEERVLDALK